MHTHILISTDGSDLSEIAIDYGIALAKAVRAKVTGITVSSPVHGVAASLDEGAASKERAKAVDYLARIAAAAERAKVDFDLVHAEHEHPYRAIVETANTKGCDLIVMASHGRRRIPAAVLGSQAANVLAHSSIPVLVVRGERSSLFPAYFAAS